MGYVYYIPSLDLLGVFTKYEHEVMQNNSWIKKRYIFLGKL